MAQVLAPKDQWFVVHVLSGQENKVRDNIEKRVKTEEMGDVIFEVLVPTEASSASPSPSTAAPPRWSWNTGRWNADKNRTGFTGLTRLRRETEKLSGSILKILLILSKKIMAKEVVAHIKLQIPAGQAN